MGTHIQDTLYNVKSKIDITWVHLLDQAPLDLVKTKGIMPQKGHLLVGNFGLDGWAGGGPQIVRQAHDGAQGDHPR
jgi:hypothetical protein